jgi:hypothetical protein
MKNADKDNIKCLFFTYQFHKNIRWHIGKTVEEKAFIYSCWKFPIKVYGEQMPTGQIHTTFDPEITSRNLSYKQAMLRLYEIIH